MGDVFWAIGPALCALNMFFVVLVFCLLLVGAIDLDTLFSYLTFAVEAYGHNWLINKVFNHVKAFIIVFTNTKNYT